MAANMQHMAGAGQMMQQQASQKPLHQQGQQPQSQPQQQQGVNGAQGGNDFTSFTPNMESIEDQQMNGLMAQQASQMVVPASNGPNRNPTPQPMGQNMPNQQGPNQGVRPPAQQQQPQQNVNLQRMKMNQAAQNQNQAHMKSMQGQAGVGGNMQPAQSPAMNTLNTPVSRPPNGMNPMGNQSVGQNGVQFGDQRFNQGAQRPNNQAFQNMLANLSQEQRATISGLAPDQLNEVMQRWQNRRQENMAMNGGQGNPGQMQNRPPGQMGQMNPNMGGQMPVGMQQPGGPMNSNQPQMPMRIQNPQAIAMMDTMDLPPQVLQHLNQVPPEVKKWGQLKMWLNQNNVGQKFRNQLATVQQRQFQLILQRRNNMMPQQQQQQPQPGQPNNANPGMQNPGGVGPNGLQGMRQQVAMNVPPQLLQATAQDLAQVRSQRPTLANIPDEQLRAMVIQMKKHSWMQQQQLRNQAQAQAQAHAQAQAARNQAQSFAFGALSPHGNPSYGGKPPKDMNLQLPPARKKQKTTGQTPQGATPSPQISKKSSPDMRRASESQAPPKPVLLCKEPECEHSTVGFPNEQALQNHIQEEHTKPHEDPMGFVRDNLALALGLEPDGTVKKEKLEAPPMSMTNSKQGQTPATMTTTPMSGDGMKRSASSMGKPQDNKAGNKTSQELSKMNTLRQLSYTISEDCTEETKIRKKRLIALRGLPEQRKKRTTSSMKF
ncbi:hypothetical protein NW757_013255 [Fusarium falciforme]|nr:hypothetical protein NW757_013255 [Fusarium falciforme]